MPRESEILSAIRNRSRASDRVRVGIGDDAAVIKTDGAVDLLACCDLIVEGVHFRTDWAGPKLIGHKALAATLSDVAAMGGVPRFAMISIALPQSASLAYAEEILQGIFDLADACQVTIVGGDTSSSPDTLFIDTSVIGDCAAGSAITRAGAKAGDIVYVTGSLGASAYGLRLLEQGVRLKDYGEDGLLEECNALRRLALIKHLAPEPRLEAGRAIGEKRIARAMIDISDGLSTDLSHILEQSNCGAVLRAGAIPIAESAERLSKGDLNVDPLGLALHGGEEYELLFTARREDHSRVVSLSETLRLAITPIGEIVAEKGLQIEEGGKVKSLPPSGYEHIV